MAHTQASHTWVAVRMNEIKQLICETQGQEWFLRHMDDRAFNWFSDRLKFKVLQNLGYC